jgi:hypothetical protein
MSEIIKSFKGRAIRIPITDDHAGSSSLVEVIKNLYSHDAWRLAYPGIALPETTVLTIQSQV